MTEASAPKHDEGYTPVAGGGQVYWQSWEPTEPKGVVVIAHGLAEHGGRYVHVARRLTSAGYAVAAGDHRGHGRSHGVKGNIDRMSLVLDDLDAVIRSAAQRHPGLPLFLLGHSMGGLVALDYVVSRGQEHLAGLVLSAPAVDPSVGSAVERLAAPLLARVLPNLPVTTLDVTAVSRDPEVVAAYRADPLNYLGKIRARTGAELLAATARVQKRLPSIKLPVLVMQGGDDRIVRPAGAQTVCDRVSSTDVTQRSYPGLFHEIFNEPEQNEVLDDVVDWLDAHPAAAGSARP